MEVMTYTLDACITVMFRSPWFPALKIRSFVLVFSARRCTSAVLYLLRQYTLSKHHLIRQHQTNERETFLPPTRLSFWYIDTKSRSEMLTVQVECEKVSTSAWLRVYLEKQFRC